MRNSVPPGKGKEPDPEVSVDLARLTVPPNSPVYSLTTAGKPNQGIGALQAGFPRLLGLDVVHAPILSPPESPNLAHSLILGNASAEAMELCDVMAKAMSENILIYPVGSPWRERIEPREQP